MAEIRKRVRNGKTTWLARYYDPDGSRISRTFTREKAAKDYLVKVENSKLDQSYIDPARMRLPVGDMADLWLATQGHLKPSTMARYSGIVTKYVKPRWGRTPLGKVSHADIAAWISSIRLAPASKVYIHRVLYLILELAKHDRRLSYNPAIGVKLPKTTKTQKRFLSRAEVFRLADAAAQYPIPEVGEQYRVLVLVLAFCGLRWGEAAGLKVERVDWLKRRLSVKETLIEVGGHLIWDAPKDHQEREVPIPGFVVDMLAEITVGKNPGDLVFTTWRGKPLRNLNWRRDCFDKAAEDAGLHGLTPHEMRHACASLAVSAGANVKAVQRMLGHKKASMTLDVYTDLFEDDLDGVAERLDAATVADGYPVGTRDGRAEVINLRPSL
jgi:integrase